MNEKTYQYYLDNNKCIRCDSSDIEVKDCAHGYMGYKEEGIIITCNKCELLIAELISID